MRRDFGILLTSFSFTRLKLNEEIICFVRYVWKLLLEFILMSRTRFGPMFMKKLLKFSTIGFGSFIRFPSFIMALMPLLLFLFLHMISLIMLHVFRVFALFSVKLNKLQDDFASLIVFFNILFYVLSLFFNIEKTALSDNGEISDR